MKTALISGNGITGPALAYWLGRAGYRSTIVERAPVPRPGGQAVDIRGAALKVVAAMGLLEQAHAKRTALKGMTMLDADGSELFRSDSMTLSGGEIDNEDIEILRDELSALLLTVAPEATELIYGDSIAALDEDADGVTVRFEKAPPRRFDLVFGADGVQSATRALAFGDAAQFLSPLDVGMAIYSAPNHLGLEDWEIYYRHGRDFCLVYTVNHNRELRVCLRFPATLAEERQGGIAGQKALVRQRCASFGWETPALLDAMDSSADFWLGSVAQVIMPHFTRGRVALVGDAGYCPSPYSGQGTSLSLVGAQVLADELGKAQGNHAAAFARYEERMRPFIEHNQELARLGLKVGLDNEEGQQLFGEAMEVAKNAIELEGV